MKNKRKDKGILSKQFRKKIIVKHLIGSYIIKFLFLAHRSRLNIKEECNGFRNV